MDIILVYSLIVFSAFWVVNYSALLERIRLALFPALPRWLAYSLTCPVCFCFWTTGTICFFWWGYTPLIFTAPMTMLYLDLVYGKLTKS